MPHEISRHRLLLTSIDSELPFVKVNFLLGAYAIHDSKIFMSSLQIQLHRGASVRILALKWPRRSQPAGKSTPLSSRGDVRGYSVCIGFIISDRLSLQNRQATSSFSNDGLIRIPAKLRLCSWNISFYCQQTSTVPRSSNFQIRAMHQFNNNLCRMDTTLTSTSNPTQKTKPLPQFIVKLHHILENPTFRKAIAWGSQSGQVCIINQRQLETTVLPQFFRHHKTESFVRQLNNYGFSKLPTTRVGEELRFRNPFFLKDNPKALKHIKRKSKKEQKHSIKPTEELPRTELSMNQLEDIVELAAELADLVRRYPAIRPELDRAFQIMNSLTSNHPSIKDKLEDEQIKADYNLFQSLRGGQLDHVKLVSACSFDDGLELADY